MIFKFIKTKISNFWDDHTLGITLTLLLIVFFIALFWNMMFISIDPGHQGIRWARFGGTQIDERYKEGLHIIWPWDRMYVYTTRVQTGENVLEILTAEGLTIEVDYSYRFYAIPDSIPVIHKKLGVDYAKTYIQPEVEAASMAIIGNYEPDQLYKISTLVIQSTIKYYLNKQLPNKNVVVDDYLIRKITLPESVAQAIEKKMVARQLSFEFDYKLEIEEKEKKRKALEAAGIKNFEDISGIPILKWKGLEVTSEFANSENSKIIIMGSGENDLPLLLNTDDKK